MEFFTVEVTCDTAGDRRTGGLAYIFAYTLFTPIGVKLVSGLGPADAGPRCWALWGQTAVQFRIVFVLSGCVGHTYEFWGPTPTETTE